MTKNRGIEVKELKFPMSRMSIRRLWVNPTIAYGLQTQPRIQYNPFGCRQISQCRMQSTLCPSRLYNTEATIWSELAKEGFLSRQKPKHIEGNMSSVAQRVEDEEQHYHHDHVPLYFPGDVLERRWEFVRKYRHRKSKSTIVPLTFASYNVLAQNLLEDHKDMYRNCPSEYLDWKYRRFNLCAEIVHLLPDIICLQEVQEEHFYDSFMPSLEPLGYRGEYLKRTNDKQDGCATFYNTKKFMLDTVQKVEYFIQGSSVLDRDNVGLVLLLRDAEHGSGAKICVANTHLLFNPRRGDIKLAQLQLLFAEIDKLAYVPKPPGKGLDSPQTSDYCPILLCGDFNSLPLSDLYKFVKNGHLHIEGKPRKAISGQEKYPSSHPRLEGAVIPKSFGISDQCQFVRLYEARQIVPKTSLIDTDEIEELRRMTEMDEKEKHRQSEARSKHAKRKRSRSKSKAKRKRQEEESDVEQASVYGDRDEPKAMTYSELRTQVHKPRVKDLEDGEIDDLYDFEDDSQVIHHKKTVHIEAEDIHSKHVDPHFVVISKEEVWSSQDGDIVIPKEDIDESTCSHMDSKHETDLDSHNENKGISDHATSAEEKRNKHCSYGSGHMSHRFGFHTAYDHQRMRGSSRTENEVTTCHGRAQCTVDYIFYTKGGKEKGQGKLELSRRLELYTDVDMSSIGTLPNKYISSDHTVLMAEFEWNVGKLVSKS